MLRSCSRFRLLAAVAVAVVASSLAAAAPASAAQPAPTVKSGAATISAVGVNGTAVNYGFVAAGGSVQVTGTFKVGDTGGALDQIQIGWAGSESPAGCVYDGQGPAKGTFSFDLGAPPSPQTNFVIVNFAQDFGCLASGSSWWSSNTGPAVAEVDVVPPSTVTSGPVTYRKAGIDALGANPAVRGAGSQPGLRVKYSIADTGGISAAVLVGWAGSSKAIGCLYSGPGNQPVKTATFRLGTPPKATGGNVVQVAFYPSCDLTRWSTLTKTPLAVLYVDRDL